MVNRAVARVELDGTARSKIAGGVNSVFTNNKKTAHAGSITMRGNTVVQGATTVFVENKPIARAGDLVVREGALVQGSLNVFASDIKAADIDIAQSKTTAVEISNYVSNPSKYDNRDAAANGAKQYYPPVPTTPLSTSTGEPMSSSSDIIPFLTARLAEGGWRETGQGGRPSNPKILNVWTELGFTRTNPWTTDQTPWCMGFINYALRRTGYRWAPEASARAIQSNTSRWRATSVPVAQMQPGDIVLWSFSHVNFCYTADQGRYTFVGGNQTPTSGVRNPNDGDLTISWPTGWTSSKGGIVGVFRPSKN